MTDKVGSLWPEDLFKQCPCDEFLRVVGIDLKEEYSGKIGGRHSITYDDRGEVIHCFSIGIGRSKGHVVFQIKHLKKTYDYPVVMVTRDSEGGLTVEHQANNRDDLVRITKAECRSDLMKQELTFMLAHCRDMEKHPEEYRQ